MPPPISDTPDNIYQHYNNQLHEQLDTIFKYFQVLDSTEWKTEDAEILLQLLHNFTSSTGSHGMPSLSNAAHKLEIQLATLIYRGNKPDNHEWAATGKAIQQLVRMARERMADISLNRQPAQLRQRPAQSPLVYLLEDKQQSIGSLQQALVDAGYRLEVFSDSAELLARCTHTAMEHPAALVLNISDTSTTGPLADIKACNTGTVPIIFISSRDDLATRLAARRAGACHYLLKPIDTDQLITQLDALSGLQPHSPFRVLILDKDPLLLDAYAEILRATGMIVQTLSQPLQLLEQIDDFKPDVLVLEVYMEEANGPELAAVLRERETNFHLPILFLSAETDISQQLVALNLGGDDCLVKPVEAEHLITAVSTRAERLRQNNRLQQHLASSLYEREREHLTLNQHAIVSFADAAGNISYVNDQFCKVSGYSRHELLGQNHRIVKSNEHPSTFYEDLWRTISQGDIWQGEICNQRKDGSLYWVASTITPFLDAQGKPYQYVSVRTDITHVKQAKSALMKNQARLNFLVSSSPVCIYTSKATPPYEASYISPNIRQLMGYEPRQFTEDASFWASNIHPDDCQQVFENLPQLFEHNTHQHEYRYRMPDGSYRWMHDEMRLIRNEASGEDEIIGYWADITERKQAEIDSRENEARFRQTLDQAPALIWLADTENKGIWYNQRWLEFTGRSMEQELGFGWLEGMHEDDSERCASFCQGAFDERERFEMEFRLRRADGSYGWIVDTGIPRFDNEGNFEGYIGYCWDITDRKHVEEAAETLKERLRRGQIYANIGTWEWKIQTGELYWSERIAPLFGYPEGDLDTSYDNFLAAVHPDDRQAVSDAVTACVTDDAPYEIEHRVVWPDGTIRWLLERGAVVRSADGTPLEMLGVVQDIDDRKRADMALIERERQLREAQTLARIGNWAADISTGELYWSDEIYRIFGHEPGSFTPSVEAFHAAVHPDDLARVHESEKLAEQSGLHDIIHRIVRPDGKVRHVHELAQAETDTEGNRLRLTGTVQDITERVEAETRLHETEERFAFAVEGAGDGVWDWDMRSNAMQFSRVYMEMLGYAENELPHIVDTWLNSVHADDLAPVQQKLLDFLEGRIPIYAVELRLRCKDNSYRWILCRGTVVKRDDKGRPIRMIGIHSDITDRKQAEQGLVTAQEIAHLGSFEWHPLSGNLQWSDEHYRLWGLEPQSIEPSYELFRQGIAEEDLPRVEEHLQQALRGDSPYDCTHRVVRPDGEVRHVHGRGEVTFNASGQAIRMVGTVLDITDNKASEQALITARDEADHANRAKSEFLSNMSHELRTPMNAILGFGQILELDTELSREHRENIQEILKGGRHLLTLINEILDLSKIESGSIDLSLEPVELCPVIDECIALTRNMADKRNIQLSRSGIKGSAVRADQTRFKQILINLLSNAIKYNRIGGSVKLDVQRHGTDRLRILVTDTGMGIATERLGELFQPFNRLDAENSGIEGTGIGLTITRRIVEMMGGTVDVSSKIGVGSTFWIELPVETLTDDISQHQTISKGIKATQQETSEASRIILYIEDNPSNLKLVTQILGRRPHIHLLTAHTPELGIELARSRHPELILLDINMPGMDGYQVLEILKEDASLKNTPVVAVTANAMPKDIAAGKASGFTDYVTKPLDILHFNKVVDKCLAPETTA